MKIGKLIKQNKLYEIYNTNSSIEYPNTENLICDLLENNKVKFPNFQEAQNLIKNSCPEGQSILIAILELQLSLIGNEINYIKYEKINEKIIEKNIYWIITKEIHKRVHKEKKENEFEEYCHCIHDEKEKYILDAKYNFKYEKIEPIISKLKFTNKNIEFITIKSIYISFYNIICEYIQKYLEINKYIKNNNNNEYSIFEYIINDFLYLNEKIKFVNVDFNESLNNFKNEYKMNFSFEHLFKDIFFNNIFNNEILGFQFIHAFTDSDEQTKKSLFKILNLIGSNLMPLNQNICKILNIEDLFNFKMDLTTKILEKNEKLSIYLGNNSIEKDINEKNTEKKEVICISGSIEQIKNKNFKLSADLSKINIEKFILDIEKNDLDSIPKPTILNHIESNYNLNENKVKDINNNIKSDNLNIAKEIKSDKKNKDKNKKKEKEIVNIENKYLDEIYEYISKDNLVGNKKKKKRNKAKAKKSKVNEKEGSKIDYIENDPIVIKFKNDLKDKYIFANQITKIKPLISEKWIKEISSY